MKIFYNALPTTKVPMHIIAGALHWVSRHLAGYLKNKQYQPFEQRSLWVSNYRVLYNVRLTVRCTVVHVRGESMIFTPSVQPTTGSNEIWRNNLCFTFVGKVWHLPLPHSPQQVIIDGYKVPHLRSPALKLNKTEKPRVYMRFSRPPKPNPQHSSATVTKK